MQGGARATTNPTGALQETPATRGAQQTATSNLNPAVACSSRPCLLFAPCGGVVISTEAAHVSVSSAVEKSASLPGPALSQRSALALAFRCVKPYRVKHYRQLTARCHRIFLSIVFSRTCAYSSSSESTRSPSLPNCSGSASNATSKALTVRSPSSGEYHCGGGSRRISSRFPAPSSIRS